LIEGTRGVRVVRSPRGDFREPRVAPGPSEIVALHGGTARVQLQAAGFSAVAGPAFGEPQAELASVRRLAGPIGGAPGPHRVMAPLSGDALQATPDSPVHHDPPAHPGTQNHPEDDAVPVGTPGAQSRFRQRETVRVVLELDAPPERVAEILAKGPAIETHRIGVLHEPFPPGDRPGHAEARRERLRSATDTGGDAPVARQGGFEPRFVAALGAGRHPPPNEHLEALVRALVPAPQDGRLDLRTAE